MINVLYVIVIKMKFILNHVGTQDSVWIVF